MKLKDNILVYGGLVAILLFIVFMFEYHRRVESHRLIREDLYNDSIIMEGHKQLMANDTTIMNQSRKINSTLKKYEKRLNRLEYKTKDN